MSELAAVSALWKRELLRFLRSRSRIIGALGFPFFFLAVVGTGLNSAMPGSNYLDFMAPGILAMVLMFGSTFSGVTVIMDRQFGFLKETLVAPIGRLSIVAGKCLGGATTAVIQGMLMLGIAALIGADMHWSGVLLLLPLMALVSLSFVALGIALASMMEDMHGFQMVMNFLIMPMFFLSGALFPLTTAPDLIRYISYIDPLTYAVEAFRSLLTGESMMPLQLSVGVLSAFLAVTLSAAAWLFGRIEE